MKTSEVLLAARELIADPVRWVQGYEALDGYGQLTFATDETATCWCLLGALARVVSDGGVSQYQCGLAADFIRAIARSSLVNWNDAPERTHAEVIDALTKAAEIARREESTC